jgi:hypothetical protein
LTSKKKLREIMWEVDRVDGVDRVDKGKLK